MKKTQEEKMDFIREVVLVVRSIPPGKVLTYGDVAALAGQPSCSRQVGKILRAIGVHSETPCHRVVNFQGRTAPHWPDQIRLLKEEGIVFTSSSLVKMEIHRWKPIEIL